MSDTSRKILGALTIFPGLLTATEELSSGLFYGRERKVFESISALWSESQPDTLDLAILAEMVGGDNPVTYVTNLLKPDELGATEKPVFLAMVEEVVGKRKLLSDDVKLWIECGFGEWSLPQAYSELGATSVSEKDIVRQTIHRLKEAGDRKSTRLNSSHHG